MLDANLVSIILISTLSLTYFSAFGSIPSPARHKIDRFFRFDEESDSWVLIKLPYDLVTCNNGNCTVVGSIRQAPNRTENVRVKNGDSTARKANKEIYRRLLPLRKRVSLTKMSDASIWITGQSGSIYERFWNGVQWVIAPHDLPEYAESAVSVFFVNQTILALSESGYLYQMQLIENSQLLWTKFEARVDHNEKEESVIKSGVVTKDGERIYFCTKNGSLVELVGVEPPRWVNHGQPPGADVAGIADVETLKPNLIFTLSSAGDLYEYDKSTKPPWKKHVWRKESAEHTSLLSSGGCSAQVIGRTSSISLFLLNKAGEFVERRLNQRKWKWIIHGRPEDQLLTSITPVPEDESSEKYSVFLTTASGSIMEYQTTKQIGMVQQHQLEESWINHMHPPHAMVARGIAGIAYQFGRLIFPLDDGRIAELHLAGIGGENTGPDHQPNTRKRISSKYYWTTLDAPETEGWNAEYCKEERGPSNCLIGVKDETNDYTKTRTMTRRRKGMQQNYLIPNESSINLDETKEDRALNKSWVDSNFGLRVIQGGRSFFMVSKNGMAFEYLYSDNVGLWLKHEHPTAMKGAVGSYNGSLFLIDIHGALLIRERSNNELQWINCTSMKKGKELIGGPPWDRIHSAGKRITANDAIYFISKKGRLLQFTVALRNFKWKDCKNPANTKIATLVDQEMCRDKVIFVIGRNGRLYQYNTLSGLWHEHHQSQHLILSRLPGTAIRPSLSMECSLFMISQDGGLFEYHWNSLDGWVWFEHGTPNEEVNIAGAPGPSFEGHQLFVVGSDGKVYLRFFNGGEWKWRDYGFPDSETIKVELDGAEELKHQRNKRLCHEKESVHNAENCDAKVIRYSVNTTNSFSR
ncbi:uncharacterized protein LOC130796775 isoform X2 [Amaranthus tricolor]|uniref:uncharacterized protein LOC130796775 isoform X2 n=1 Tax=Amaranthus tricolor TaxID=29722 RepID=UPI002585AA94|nr:uncharacterized protein LOC130796775 isoform X2 [Amaranthus tricolor]